MNKNIIDLFQLRKNSKLIEHINKISPEAREQEIEHDRKKYTLLALSVLFNNQKILDLLLKLKVNPNSKKYPNGFPLVAPISLCTNKQQIDKLILSGADINMSGLNQQTLLTNLIQKSFENDKHIDLIKYILSKGSNTNLPLYNLPLNNFILIVKKLKRISSYKKTIATLIDLLLTYFANPTQKDMNGISAQDILLTKSRRKYVENIYKSFKDIINDDKSKITIDYVSRLFKINSKNRHKCIQYILNHKEEIDYQDISRRRNYTNCNNDTTFAFNELNEFSKSEIYIYKDSNNIEWCFHMSEIPNLINTQKNPWTNVKLSTKEISNMYFFLDYIPEYTLEEATTEIFERDNVSVNNKKRLSYLSTLVESVNTYVGAGLQQTISELPNIEILEIFRLINGYGISFKYDEIYNVYLTNNKEILIHKLYNLVIDKLQSGKLTLHILSIILDQVFKDYDVFKNFIRIIGDISLAKSYFDYFSQPFTSEWIAGKRNSEEINGIVTHNYTGGAMLTSDQARNISQMIEIRIGNNTPYSIDNYWRELYEVLKRNL
jgi:hypothetical protein